jgi:CRISPR-associated endonuclease/helicase Cas3
MPAQFPAHIRVESEWETVQSAEDHCRGTAKIAQRMLSGVQLGTSAYIAGLLHDAGKFTEAFRDYMEQAAHGKNPPRGSVNHTFAGVRFLLKVYHTPKDESDLAPIVAELLAFAVGAHHGLFDCVDENGNNGFAHRLDKPNIHYEEAVGNFLDQCADREEMDGLFDESVRELSPVLMSLCDLAQQDDRYNDELSFYIGLLTRVLLSAVIEGDRRDTAEFMNGAAFSDIPENRQSLWNACLTRVEQKLGALSTDSAINRARRTISEKCRACAEQPSGVFRLNVPTGSGKTLASLRFALAHAAKWNKSRLIFASPLLSILDQNAQVMREYIQDDSLILEHHSNVIRSVTDGEIVDGSDPELLMENWGAPIIITTFVQILDAIFSGKTSCIRRFHALADSVIVIDEIQTLPTRMLTLFNLAVNFLSEICGATVVLCSATQPCLEQTVHPINVPIRDIVPYDDALWKPFQRTTILDAGKRRLEDIPTFALEQLDKVSSLLVVCNKKDEAAYLYHQLSCGEADCFHLSASMCMAHRRKTLDAIQDSLQSDAKTICVATQIIEAGVDISFQCVIRLTAGLDNIIQSAGRCNRNGEQAKPMPVYALECAGENLSKLSDIKSAKSATTSLLAQFETHPNDFQNDLSSDEAVRYYYNRLYREMPSGFQDYTINGKPSIFSLLSENKDFREGNTDYELNQAFKEAGALFQVFDDKSEDVIVPYGDGAACIADLCSERAKRDPVYLQSCLERAKPYTVSIFEYQKKQLIKQKGLYAVCDDKILILQPQYYDDDVGLVTGKEQNDYMESCK